MLYRIHINKRKKIKITCNPTTWRELRYYHFGVFRKYSCAHTYMILHMKMGSDTLRVICFLCLVALFHVPLNALPMIYLMALLIIHYLDTSVFLNQSLICGYWGCFWYFTGKQPCSEPLWLSRSSCWFPTWVVSKFYLTEIGFLSKIWGFYLLL